MDKNWLIRTKSNHILGPVSKEKVLELYQNGSIKPDDEVCSGNGYWFFIREEELVERFLTGPEIQGFNPISEAKDVLLIKAQSPQVNEETNDITLIGGIDLKALNSNKIDEELSIPKVIDQDSNKSKEMGPSELSRHEERQNLEPETQESKKKSKLKPRRKAEPIKKEIPLKKQEWLKYVSILGFIILFLMIYFRKRIINTIFNSSSVDISLSIINKTYAQDLNPEKKKLLGEEITLEKVKFSPAISLNGFKVTSNIEIEDVDCQTLGQSHYQLAVILFPPEKINEKFLIKMRDCVVKLHRDHPLKRWIQWVAKPRKINIKDQKTYVFTKELIQSHFNLITDQKMKEQIIKLIKNIPENTLPEKILKSYCYLLIGNITRSNRILSEIITTPPRVNWEKLETKEKSIFHQIGIESSEQILKKLATHPADRKMVHLLLLYLKSFYNDPQLLSIINDFDVNETYAKVDLKYVKSLAPELIQFLRLSKIPKNKRDSYLRENPIDFQEQAYWVWAFIDLNLFSSDDIYQALLETEKKDELWFIYLMEDEKFSDLFSKKTGKSFLPARRSFLNQRLTSPETFWMSLYKMVQLGDINQVLVEKTIKKLIDE
jgi:hypothetical protein